MEQNRFPDADKYDKDEKKQVKWIYRAKCRSPKNSWHIIDVNVVIYSMKYNKMKSIYCQIVGFSGVISLPLTQ